MTDTFTYDIPKDADRPIISHILKLEGSGPGAVSPKGAKSRYQITKATADHYGIDYNRLGNEDYAHRSAIRIADDLEKKYPGDEQAQLVAWNAGPGGANKWISGGRKDDTLLPETRAYLAHADRIGVEAPAGSYTYDEPGKPSGRRPAPQPPAPPPRTGVLTDVASRTHENVAGLRSTIADVKAHPKDPVNALKTLGAVADYASTQPFVQAGAALDQVVRPGVQAYNALVKPKHPADTHATTDAIINLAGAVLPGEAEKGLLTGANRSERAAIKDSVARLREGQKSPEKALYAENVEKLKSQGVYVTPGQERGGEAARKESAQKSDPALSEVRRKAENKSLASLNTAVYNRILTTSDLPPVDESLYPGRTAVKTVKARVSQAYNEVKPGIKAVFDAPMTDTIKKATAEIPQAGKKDLQAFLQQHIQPLLKGGVLDGQGYIDAKSALAEEIRGLRNDPSHKVNRESAAYENILTALTESAERYSEPGVRDRLRKLDTSWAMLTRLEEASTRNIKSQGQFSPSDLAQAVRHQSPSRGGRRTVFATGDALLQDISDPAMAVLPDRTPASDTAEKIARNKRGLGGFIGAGTGAGIGAGIGAHFGHPVMGAEVGAAMGGAAGAAVDAASSNKLAANLAERALARHALQQASRSPRNYLRAIDRRVSPLVQHAGAVNALKLIGQQGQQ